MKIHSEENNAESEKHLKENKTKFSQQCLRVLELLRQGKRLTTSNAPGYGILSLPRRIKDLRDKNGIAVNERWLQDEKGSNTIKEWFIDEKTENQIVKEVRYKAKEMTAADHASKLVAATKAGKLEQQNLFNND
jgi:hypothetical protein